jgi:hypothetical protein
MESAALPNPTTKILSYFESKMVFLPMTSLSFFTIFLNVSPGNAASRPASIMLSAFFFHGLLQVL